MKMKKGCSRSVCTKTITSSFDKVNAGTLRSAARDSAGQLGGVGKDRFCASVMRCNLETDSVHLVNVGGSSQSLVLGVRGRVGP